MEIIFYSTHCPKCEILEKKLKQAALPYRECDDVPTMLALGLETVPALSVDNTLMDFGAAVKWIKNQGGLHGNN